MALDIFHERIAVGTLDEFEFTALDENKKPVNQDESHEVYSFYKGSIEKIDDCPYMPESLQDYGLTAGQLEVRYVNEHPRHQKTDWSQEVQNDDTKLGYWDWVIHQVESEHTDTDKTAVEATTPACSRPRP